MNMQTVVEKFLNNELTANEIEEMLKNGELVFDATNSIEYGELTKPLNKKYYEIMGEGIEFDLEKQYPSKEDCFIYLLKAIENKKNVEEYYSEYLNK